MSFWCCWCFCWFLGLFAPPPSYVWPSQMTLMRRLPFPEASAQLELASVSWHTSI